MKIFDPHIHMSSRTTDDFEAMAKAGIVAVVEPAFWSGQPRTHVGTFEDYFLSLIGWERFRTRQFGIHHFCTLAMNPKESNNRVLSEKVLAMMPRYLEKDGVVGIGEIGFDDQTDVEDDVFTRQIEMAGEYGLPLLIHTPHRDKKRGTQRIIDKVREMNFPEKMVLIDHNTEETLPLVRDTGCWAGHSIYPFTKMTEERMTALIKQYGSDRMLVNSAADWGVSDPLKVPKTVEAMREGGLSEEEIEKVVWHNPVEFFAQSGRLDLEELETRPKIDQTQLYQGSSVLRGQTPKVDK